MHPSCEELADVVVLAVRPAAEVVGPHLIAGMRRRQRGMGLPAGGMACGSAGATPGQRQDYGARADDGQAMRSTPSASVVAPLAHTRLYSTTNPIPPQRGCPRPPERDGRLDAGMRPGRATGGHERCVQKIFLVFSRRWYTTSAV